MIAVVRELRAKGEFTSTVLGVTVFCDIFVLVLFTFTSNIAHTYCIDQPFNLIALLVSLGNIVAAIGTGALTIHELLSPILVDCECVVWRFHSTFVHDSDSFSFPLLFVLFCLPFGSSRLGVGSSAHRLALGSALGLVVRHPAAGLSLLCRRRELSGVLAAPLGGGHQLGSAAEYVSKKKINQGPYVGANKFLCL